MHCLHPLEKAKEELPPGVASGKAKDRTPNRPFVPRSREVTVSVACGDYAGLFPTEGHPLAKLISLLEKHEKIETIPTCLVRTTKHSRTIKETII